ncbi:hypothetical protein FQZ97_743870 [compost metagenome]
MLAGVMPPTGSTGRPAGSTARQALSPSRPIASAGNSFSASAPAASAANASVGVATPGMQSMPAALAARMTSVSAWGMTIRRPPAAAISQTCSARVTVPAPTRYRSPRAWLRLRMLSSGRGELSGTSSMRKPASARAPPIDAASPGCRPRRMATRGRGSNQVFSMLGFPWAPVALRLGSGPYDRRGATGHARWRRAAARAGGCRRARRRGGSAGTARPRR